MRWSIVRLIWLRELRDQLRDRRTVFMVAILPVLLYPAAGLGLTQMVSAFYRQQHVVGVAGLENLMPQTPDVTPVSALAFTPAPPGCAAAAADRAAAVAALALPGQAFPPLLEEIRGRPHFRLRYLEQGATTSTLLVRPLDIPLGETDLPDGIDRRALDARQVDVMLVVPPDFRPRLAAGDRPELYLLTREKDDTARRVNQRLNGVLARWKFDLRQQRLERMGLPGNFDESFRVRDTLRERPTAEQGQDGLFSLLLKVFPFILVLWSLAGALYPAVDLCAGEKERGTMETLLISPAGRAEIVLGKFLTIWVFSAATALLNLASMGLTTWQLAGTMPGAAFSPAALFWGVVLLLPLSAFFSAVCLAVGAYARSSKEGQYYLMPLFMLTMPLIFLTLAPGVELNPFYSMVPVTGVALLLQRLMSQGLDRAAAFYFVPVLAPIVIYSWLALRWAIEQFQREEVLFREAERLDLALYLRTLFRDKEALPTASEALFCFGLIVVLRWISFGVGTQLQMLTRTGVAQLAFVAAPPLFMALLLTTRPRQGLALRLPPWWAWPTAALLGALAVPPLAELMALIIHELPVLKDLLRTSNPILQELEAVSAGNAKLPRVMYFVVLALLPAMCEEVAFRGFILSGLRRGFREWPAILLNAFLFSLYQMNVFQFVPHFLLGIVLGLLAVRTGSVLPPMLFRAVYNSLLIAPVMLGAGGNSSEPSLAGAALAVACIVFVGAGILALARGSNPHEAPPPP